MSRTPQQVFAFYGIRHEVKRSSGTVSFRVLFVHHVSRKNLVNRASRHHPGLPIANSRVRNRRGGKRMLAQGQFVGAHANRPAVGTRYRQLPFGLMRALRA